LSAMYVDVSFSASSQISFCRLSNPAPLTLSMSLRSRSSTHERIQHGQLCCGLHPDLDGECPMARNTL
jgi:hypothetical protein